MQFTVLLFSYSLTYSSYVCIWRDPFPFKLMAHLIRSSIGLARGPRRRFALRLIFRGVLSSNGGTFPSLPPLLWLLEALPQLMRPKHHHVAEPEGQERGVEVSVFGRGHERNTKMLSRFSQRLGSVLLTPLKSQHFDGKARCESLSNILSTLHRDLKCL